MKAETIVENFNNQEIAFDLFRGDVMVNATEMAKAFGKRVDVFTKTKQTKALIDALVQDRKLESKYHQLVVFENQILVQKRGNHGGTFMCEDLALAFAMWLSPEFHVWILKTVREIIFGNNPELVREAVMNMPRIQKELDRLRRKRNRIKAALLGPDRRREMNGLVSRRAQINSQLMAIMAYDGAAPLYSSPEEMGREMVKMMQERESITQEIRAKEDDFSKVLVSEEYIDLIKSISQLEKEQRHFAKLIRYSEIKPSLN